ncbi:MAG: hypothetical protein EOP53_19280 [Sphingobacteriales bacterium]|nr:MAG: hypothetical protein EOP53_19280 [Sphingobacteriales bacterium]
MNKILLLSGIVMLAFASCKDKEPAKPDPTPTPTPEKQLKSCFTMSNEFIDSGRYVSFINCSENAASYEWKFPSSSPFTEKSPPDRLFDKRGSFPISLIVRNKDATKSDTMTKTVVVGRHALTKINIKKFKAVDGSGNAWDNDGTGPDIKILYGPDANPNMYSTEVHENAAGEISFDITPNIVMGNGNNGGWTFKLIDVDAGATPPMTTIGGSPNYIYPSRGTASPFTIYNANDYIIELEWILVK